MDKKSLRDFYEAYKRWVCDNPAMVTDVENAVTWASYFFAGRVSDSQITSEIVYSLCKLLALFNDQIIRDVYDKTKQPSDFKNKIKLILTIIHYCEVFNELLLKWKFSEKGKWIGVLVLRLIKTSLNLILLHKYEQMPIPNPPIPLLQRTRYVQQQNEDETESQSFKLKSGRVIRRIEGAPPIALRDWQPIQSTKMSGHEKIMNLVYAETIYTLKPLFHLLALKTSGKRSWIPWFVALGLDVTSLKLYSNVTDMNTEDDNVVRQRYANLLLYLLRSPMYDMYTKSIVEMILTLMSSKIPFARLICEPVMHYLHHWQDIYFYMWA